MSKISDIVNDNTISEFPNSSDPHWTAKTWPEKEIKLDDGSYDVFKNTVKIDTDECDKIMKNVDHPSHYQTKSGIEVIDVIEAFDLGFNLGNVCKYILRAGHKDLDIQDLEKAKWYLEREISNRKSK